MVLNILRIVLGCQLRCILIFKDENFLSEEVEYVVEDDCSLRSFLEVSEGKYFRCKTAHGHLSLTKLYAEWLILKSSSHTSHLLFRLNGVFLGNRS